MYAGDTGGIRVGPSPYVLPPTPPPDIDVRAWQASIARVRAWDPAGVFVTHFGLHRDAAAHFDALSGELDAWDRLVGTILADVPAEARLSRFITSVRERVRARVSTEEAESYRESMSLEDCWAGLERYWQKHRNPPEGPMDVDGGVPRAGDGHGARMLIDGAGSGATPSSMCATRSTAGWSTPCPAGAPADINDAVRAAAQRGRAPVARPRAL